MTKGYIVDEIVIYANMDLQWPHRMSLMPPSSTCSALTPYRDPLQSRFVPWSTLYPVDKVPVPTRLDLDATTLLKMLKTLLMVLKTLPMMMKALVMMLKPLWMMEKPFIGWRNINDPFYGHLQLNEDMKPTLLVVCWYSSHKINGGTLISPCSYGWFKKSTHMMIKPLKMSWILCADCWRSTWFMKNIL